MSNWVRNKLKFSTDNVVKELLDDENRVDFNKIIPMPITLDLPSGTITDIAIERFIKSLGDESFINVNRELSKIGHDLSHIRVAISKANMELEEESFKERYKDNDTFKYLGIDNLYKLGEFYINNLLNYGCFTWYDWCINNWDTKWNAFETNVISDREVSFSTAWSCPVNLLLGLSRKYPNVDIMVEYADEDYGNNCGIIKISNGEIEERIYMTDDKYFPLKVWDYTDEEIVEYYKEKENR